MVEKPHATFSSNQVVAKPVATPSLAFSRAQNELHANFPRARIGSFDCLRRQLHVDVIWTEEVALVRSLMSRIETEKISVKTCRTFQISTSVMRETNAVPMLYVIIFMDHTIALVKKAIMEMAKSAQVRPPQFSSFPFLLFAETALRLLL